MLTIAVPRPPRFDLLLVAILIASGIAFFAVCSDAHAATPAWRVNGVQIVEQQATTMPVVSHATLWNDDGVLKWRTPDGVDQVLTTQALERQRLADVQRMQHVVDEVADLAQLLAATAPLAARHDAPSIAEPLSAAAIGAVLMLAFCVWGQRLLIARATNAWLKRQDRAGPDGGAYRSSRLDLSKIKPPTSAPALVTLANAHLPAATRTPGPGRIIRG